MNSNTERTLILRGAKKQGQIGRSDSASRRKEEVVISCFPDLFLFEIREGPGLAVIKAHVALFGRDMGKGHLKVLLGFV
jgi:hypothetical protein